MQNLTPKSTSQAFLLSRILKRLRHPILKTSGAKAFQKISSSKNIIALSPEELKVLTMASRYRRLETKTVLLVYRLISHCLVTLHGISASEIQHPSGSSNV